MTQENQGTPIEEEGGYGTPTVEQEMGGADTKKFAQPREEEAFDAAGLSQDSPDGETYPAGAPDLSQFGAEDQDSAGEPGAGRFGGTEDQMNAESESSGPGFEPENTGPENTGPDNQTAAGSNAAVPSAEAEMDESNTEDPDAGRPFSSEPNQDAAGIPDGSGTDLPDSKAPKDRDDDSFDAG
ncbi:hypothetical protein TV39_00335 [Arthrobacter sp. SPG23]|uniref:hypothetical protein n=1 Tax=Arthrobacter sp. SPG23 TaxID=1610703 RepID=UPI0005BA13E2|nr:hypothetical protein [Arthrobacter sp. SPG23]KIS29248.1 hypothetical protein TV39_00335 [Arthrobacter sp. SPG23]